VSPQFPQLTEFQLHFAFYNILGTLARALDEIVRAGLYIFPLFLLTETPKSFPFRKVFTIREVIVNYMIFVTYSYFYTFLT